MRGVTSAFLNLTQGDPATFEDVSTLLEMSKIINEEIRENSLACFDRWEKSRSSRPKPIVKTDLGLEDITDYEALRVKLRDLMLILTNANDEMPYQGISQIFLESSLGVSRKVIKNLLIDKKPTLENLNKIRESLINNFDKICETRNLNKDLIMNKYNATDNENADPTEGNE